MSKAHAGVETIGVAYGSTHGVRPAVVLERRPGRPGGKTTRVAEWNTHGQKFRASRWIADHEIRAALPPTDPRVSAMLKAYEAAEILAEIDEMT